jgi:hypothetical protein
VERDSLDQATHLIDCRVWYEAASHGRLYQPVGAGLRSCL